MGRYEYKLNMEECIGNLGCQSLKKDSNDTINRKAKDLEKNGTLVNNLKRKIYVDKTAVTPHILGRKEIP